MPSFGAEDFAVAGVKDAGDADGGEEGVDVAVWLRRDGKGEMVGHPIADYVGLPFFAGYAYVDVAVGFGQQLILVIALLDLGQLVAAVGTVGVEEDYHHLRLVGIGVGYPLSVDGHDLEFRQRIAGPEIPLRLLLLSYASEAGRQQQPHNYAYKRCSLFHHTAKLANYSGMHKNFYVVWRSHLSRALLRVP